MHNDNLSNKEYTKETKLVNRIFISVFVTAYKRRQFLIEAVKSVLSQSLSKEFFEIIVTKSFMDTETDEFLLKNDIISLYIDDDDVFLPSFLERLYDVFSLYTDVGAYQKSLAYFETSGKFYIRKTVPSLVAIKRSNFMYELGKREDFNLSISLSAFYGQLVIKKDLLLPYLNYIQNVKTSLDGVLFVIAALEKCKVFYDSEVYTLVRVHENSESMLTAKALDDTFFRNKINSITKLLCDHSLFIEMSKRYNNEMLKQAIIRSKNYALFQIIMASDAINIPKIFSITLERLKIAILDLNSDPIKAIGGFFIYSYFFMLHIMNKYQARKIFFKRSIHKFKKLMIPFEE